MKTISTLVMLPFIVLLCFYSVNCYVAGQYLAAYLIVTAWLASTIFWINFVSTRLSPRVYAWYSLNS